MGWAGNITFVGPTPADTQRIVDGFTDALHARGVQWEASSMQFMAAGRVSASAEAPERRLTWSDTIGARHPFERVDQLDLLGCVLSMAPKMPSNIGSRGQALRSGGTEISFYTEALSGGANFLSMSSESGRLLCMGHTYLDLDVGVVAIVEVLGALSCTGCVGSNGNETQNPLGIGDDAILNPGQHARWIAAGGLRSQPRR